MRDFLFDRKKHVRLGKHVPDPLTIRTGSPQSSVLSSLLFSLCTNLPSLHDLHASRTLRRAGKIVADPSHPGQKLFSPLPSDRRQRSISTKTSPHLNSFFPSAISLMNKSRNPH
ncbi:hypothetical protein PBY51_012592 [Eleginops maclovinus]|uniref:Uncharacterized protein n=1 Tax=Eleginops maclovinus TaxID=56733 RepID=A0AAN7Y4P8_ELEMC|nr:hypothetical protein PBY51_012592 [Eleginops maclovinus]